MGSKYTPEQERYFINQIRRLLAIRSSVSLDDISKALKISAPYASKLRKRALEEASRDLDQSQIKDFAAQTRLKLDVLNDELFEIILAKPQYDDEGKIINKEEVASNKDRISAMQSLRQNQDVLYKILFDAGIFKRKLGEQDTNINGLVFNVSDFITYLLDNVNGDTKRTLLDLIGKYIKTHQPVEQLTGDTSTDTVEE